MTGAEPESIVYRPIGVIHTPHAAAQGSPIQPSGARGVEGRAVLLPELEPALKDLEGFSHLILIYHLHQAGDSRLLVRPFLDGEERGLFATRAPTRPNPIGLSMVRLLEVRGNELRLADVDMLDGSPLLDLKPYVPEFDAPQGRVRTGWLSQNAPQATGRRADGRFAPRED